MTLRKFLCVFMRKCSEYSLLQISIAWRESFKLKIMFSLVLRVQIAFVSWIQAGETQSMLKHVSVRAYCRFKHGNQRAGLTLCCMQHFISVIPGEL